MSAQSVESVYRQSPKNMVEALRAEAQGNKVFSAVCHIFALRERARRQVTIAALRNKMSIEGFEFTTAQLQSVLKFMASLGIGKLDQDSKGRIRALKEIKHTLQSIGNAAIAKGEKLDRYDAIDPLIKLPGATAAPQPHIQAVQVPKTAPASGYKTTLTIDMNGKMVNFELPHISGPEELGLLLADLYVKKTSQPR